MKWKLLTATLFLLLAGTGIVAAQSPPTPTPDNHANHHQAPAPATDTTASAPGGMMGKGAMSCGMGGPMMGGMTGGMMNMMGGGMCPMMDGGMMGGAKTKVEVKKIDKGVTITLTSLDAATVIRLQKMAEAMRLMHEATTQ
jgi:hypothetical protein